MKKLLVILALLFPFSAFAGDYLPYRIVGVPTGTVPYFFGPNAFPVPDMMKNTSSHFSVELDADYAVGNLSPRQDRTFTSVFAVRFPLWSDRVNLSVYGQIHEWYWDNEEVRALRKVDPKYPLSGNTAGDAYFSLDMRLLEERSWLPRLTFRVALKTASGDKYEEARYFDAPGYHFDFCATKTFRISDESFFRAFSASLNAGFVCWQTDMGAQNDALLCAASLGVETSLANLSFDYGGYSGIEKSHDAPTTFKIKLELLPDSSFSPVLFFQKGVRDWPFSQFRFGVKYSFL